MFDPGEAIHIFVTPLVTSSTDSLYDLPLEKRQCRYKDENVDLKIFQYVYFKIRNLIVYIMNSYFQNYRYYTQDACEFECMIKHAIEHCGPCVPWHLPQV